MPHDDGPVWFRRSVCCESAAAIDSTGKGAVIACAEAGANKHMAAARVMSKRRLVLIFPPPLVPFRPPAAAETSPFVEPLSRERADKPRRTRRSDRRSPDQRHKPVFPHHAPVGSGSQAARMLAPAAIGAPGFEPAFEASRCVRQRPDRPIRPGATTP